MDKRIHLAAAVLGIVAVFTTGTASAQTTVPEPTGSAPEPPGELIDVDGHAMHLYCTGEGAPTVILDTGLGDSSVNFFPLQDEIAEVTRVCSYDRAGYGWSEPGPEPRTSDQIVTELVALLDAAGEEGPFVLAGHSFGGLNVTLLAATHPELVEGVVLIDSSHPGQLEALSEVPEMVAAQDAEIEGLRGLVAAAEAGELAPEAVLANAPPALPADLQQTWAELFVQPQSLAAAVAEYDALPESMDQVAANASLGDLPLVVLARGLSVGEELPQEVLDALGITPEAATEFDAIWRGLQEDHATRSTNGTLIVAEDSGHYVYRTEPELVVEAIRGLVEEASRAPTTSSTG